MTNNSDIKPSIVTFEDNESLRRIFLRHRFGVNENPNHNKVLHKNEELHFHLVLEELKKALVNFLGYQHNVDKLVHHIKNITSQPESIISDSDIKVQYHINIKQLIQAVIDETTALGTLEYLKKIPRRLKNKNLIGLGIKTMGDPAIDDSSESECHIKGVVFFDEKLLKLNRFDIHKNPSIIIYKIQSFDQEKLEPILERLVKSFEVPLDHHDWDHGLNEELRLEKINKISKKEHAIGNCGWITAKMLVYSIVYAIIFQSLKELGAKDIVGNKIAIAIAEYWYKLFTVDDRNRSLYAYLTKHGYKTTLEPISIANRVQMLKEFLLNPPSNADYDKELLTIIYIKSLNWLLDEYLKVGDIGSAQELLMLEQENKLFNPLFFAARNDKVPIAELLGTKSRYVVASDENGNTPFLIASSKGNMDILKILVKHQKRNGLNIQAVNNAGETALHLAVINKRRETIDYLLSLAPELVLVLDKKGRAPKDIAIEHGSTEIEKTLQKQGETLKGKQKL